MIDLVWFAKFVLLGLTCTFRGFYRFGFVIGGWLPWGSRLQLVALGFDSDLCVCVCGCWGLLVWTSFLTCAWLLDLVLLACLGFCI